MAVKTKKTAAKKTAAKRTAAKKTAAKKSAPTTTTATAPKPKGPRAKNLDIYGAAPLEWSRALKQLEAGPSGTFWLATTSPDGSPHVAGIGAL